MVVNRERRKLQLEALRELIRNKYNGIFLLPTGSGKSWVLIQALKQLVKKYNYEKIWYLCNSEDLRDVDFVNELKQWGAEYLIPKIERMCYQSAYKRKGESVDVVIADEFDYSLSEEYSKVYFNNNFKHKILTTAYIDPKKQNLADSIAKTVYQTTLQNVEDLKILNKSQYYFVHFLMNEKETLKYQKFNKAISDLHVTLNGFEYELICNPSDTSLEGKISFTRYRIEMVTRARKRFLSSLDSSMLNCRKLMSEIYNEDKDCKILTFCELTKQADRVSLYSYHNDSDPTNLEKFRNDEIQSLSVCGKVNRGVNIKGIKYMIFESTNGSKTQMLQRLGRGKRLLQDEILKVYYLIPCYYENGKIKPTKVKDWILNASKSLDLSEVKNYRFKS